jgi:hypothetical protein
MMADVDVQCQVSGLIGILVPYTLFNPAIEYSGSTGSAGWGQVKTEWAWSVTRAGTAGLR